MSFIKNVSKVLFVIKKQDDSNEMKLICMHAYC